MTQIQVVTSDGNGLPPAVANVSRLNAFAKQPSSLVRNRAFPTALGQPEIQKLSIGSPTAGTFTITLPAELGSGTTGPIAYNATGIDVQSAILATAGVPANSVTVQGAAGGPYLVQTVANGPTGLLTLNGAGLTGGTPAVTELSAGATGGPTLTRGADNGASQISNSALIAYTDPRFRIAGALTTTTLYSGRVGVIDPSPSGSHGGWQAVQRIEFETEASQFEIDMLSTGCAFRVWVNDQPHSPIPITVPNPVAFSPLKYLVNFGSRALRRIMIESEGQMAFAGIWLAKTETIWAPSTPPGPRVMWIGDSLSWGSKGGSVMTGFPHNVCRLMGWGDIWLEAWSGTGYCQTTNTFPARMADASTIAPDILVIQGSINDNPFTSTQIQNAVQSCITQAQVLADPPKIVLIGPMRMGNPQGNDLATSTAVKTAAQSAGVLFIDALAGNDGNWCAGSGYAGGLSRQPSSVTTPFYTVASLTADGPADVYSFEGTHPTADGHFYMARKVAGALQAAGFLLPA